MNENPFEKISNWLNRNSMTQTEKRELRTTLVHYATTHPVKSGLMSPYGYRAAFAIIATLILVLGGSVGVTTAAASSLPNSKLYPIKLWIEEFQASGQKTPQAVIAFETKTINTRFAEATQLAVNHQLNNQTSSIIESGLAHSQDLIQQSADQIAQTNPELALAAANSVETAYSSNGKIISAIGKNTGQNLNTFILGAQISTESLALDKTHFEQIVAMKPNSDTKSAAQAAYAKIEAGLPTLAAPVNTSPQPSPLQGEGATAVATTVTAQVATQIIAIPSPTLIPQNDLLGSQGKGTATTPTTTPSISNLVTQAKTSMDAGSYSDALVILQKVQQMIDETKLTQTLETTYQVTTDPTSAALGATSAAATPSTTTIPSPTLIPQNDLLGSQGKGAATSEAPSTRGGQGGVSDNSSTSTTATIQTDNKIK